MEVGQIVADYTLETSVGANGGFDADGNIANFAAGARLTDRPTITYVLLAGDSSIRGLLTPAPPEYVFFLI